MRSQISRQAVVVTDHSVRCRRCNALLAEVVTRPWRIRCRRCGATNLGPAQSGLSQSPEISIVLPSSPGADIT